MHPNDSPSLHSPPPSLTHRTSSSVPASASFSIFFRISSSRPRVAAVHISIGMASRDCVVCVVDVGGMVRGLKSKSS